VKPTRSVPRRSVSEPKRIGVPLKDRKSFVAGEVVPSVALLEGGVDFELEVIARNVAGISESDISDR
jgi:hypothetical protein